MFTLTDTPGKFLILLVLFAFCTVWEIVQLTRRPAATQLVSTLLHLWMAIVMLLMVPKNLWMPFVSIIPMPVIITTMVVGIAWYLFLGIRGFSARGDDPHGPWHHLGHAMMFAAMTWHLWAMHVKHSKMHEMQSGHMDHGSMGHGGMEAMDHWKAMASEPGGILWTAAIVGVPFMIYLLVAAIGNILQAVRGPRDASEAVCHAKPTGPLDFRLGALSMFAMNFGMWFMSTGLMMPLLPFMKVFAF